MDRYAGNQVHYLYRKWWVRGIWEDCWINFLECHKANLDLSSTDLDRSHTPTIRGGEAVEYQEPQEKQDRECPIPYHRQCLPLAMSKPVAGNHYDLYNIEVRFEIVTATLEKADTRVDEPFMNADAGFDTDGFRSFCGAQKINANICFNERGGNVDRDDYFNQGLYDQGYAIEGTSA